MAKELNNKHIITPPTAEEVQAAHDSFMSYLRTNPNNFSYWFPHVKELTKKINIPESVIIPIPEEIYKSFFHEREGDNERIGNWVLKSVAPTIDGNPSLKNRKIFIKNGCFSNKFNFAKSCLIDNYQDIETLISHICQIQSDALLFETDGYLELVVRQYIEPSPNTPTIYNGMPLRPEIRVFYDFDRHQYLYSVNYWDWDYCHSRICFGWNGERKLDADIYETAWPSLKAETERLLNRFLPLISNALSTVTTLTMPEGQPNVWSVDFLLEDSRVWLIDMAQAWRSAYWDLNKIKLNRQSQANNNG